MKKNLLVTTALMATALVVSSARAETNNITGEYKDKVSNEGYYGGVIYNNGVNAVINNATFTNNRKENGYGGAVAQRESLLDVTGNVTFKDNSATGGYGYGGALALRDATLTISDNANVVFDNNVGMGGGALYMIYNSSATIGSNTTLKNNKAQGGGIYSAGGAISTDTKWTGTLTLNGTKFEGNSSEDAGGAIYLSNTGTANINGATFDNNSGKYGGAISGWLGESKNNVTISSNTTFNSNNATQYGGAINAVGTYNIGDASFVNNSAAQHGGAIYNNTNSIVNLNGNTVFSGNTANGDLNDIHNNGTINVSGNITLDGGITNEGTINFVSGSNLTAKVDGSTVIAGDSGTIKGQTNLVLEGDANGKSIVLEGSKAEFTLSNNLYNIDLADDEKTYNISTKSSDEIASSIGADANQTAGVNAIISGGTDTANESFNTVAGEVYDLMQSSNKADVAKALEMVDKMSSDLSNAVTASAVANNAQVLAAVGSRFTGGSVAPAQQGMSSGDSWFEKGVAWVQGLFNKSKLDTSNGFEADSEGIAFGFEKIVNGGNSKVGVAYAYTQSDIDADSRDVDADTHTLMVYGEYKPADWFVNGVLSYSFGDYDETSSVKSASYDVDSYGLQVMAGFEKVLENGAVVTPSAGFRYLHVDPDSYTDSLGSKVDSDESDVLTAVVGAKVAKTWELENGKVLKPEVRAALTYDLTEAEDTSVVSLANGSSYAVEGENLDRLGFEFGAGISADINDKWEVSAGYEGKFREDYQDHSALLNAKYKF